MEKTCPWVEGRSPSRLSQLNRGLYEKKVDPFA